MKASKLNEIGGINSRQTKSFLQRDEALKELTSTSNWDLVIIGGGATGLGIAVDAASRGFKTLLLEQSDFAKGTSSRSTKLVHGGVRYLAQGNIGLVYDALRERGLLLKNAPHVVKRQSFIIPCYGFIDKIKYLTGLKLYDLLSGSNSFGPSKFLSRATVQNLLPQLNNKHLVGGVEYFDGQFDDARLAINLAQTSAAYGGILLNYFKVTRLLKTGGKITGIMAIDIETKKEYQLHAKTVINATGVFVDDILRMDEMNHSSMVRPSQGIHLVFDKGFLNGDHAVMIPKTSDGRVLFAVPWHDHVLVGTTDTPLNQNSMEPVALEKEIDFILDTISQYFTKRPERKDVLSVFAGLRPLAAPKGGNDSTKEISRDHKLIVSASGLITITGGKWTTYRKMAAETVDKAIELARLPKVKCKTKDLLIANDSLQDLSFDEQVRRSIKFEMARTVEDVLARRLRLLFLDAKAAIQVAPKTAEIMAAELGRDENWQEKQVSEFGTLANNYLL